MKAAGRPIVNALKGRLYSAQAAAQTQSAELGKIQVSKLPNGAVVASVDNGTALSRIAIAYNAGARHETHDNLGVTHFLRNIADLSTKDASSIKLVRQLQQSGASISCSTTREHIIYSLDCLRGDNEAPSILAGIATSPALKAWELNDAKAKIVLDAHLVSAQPNILMTEALHHAAYRRGLGNSLFTPAHKFEALNADMVSAYVNSHFASSRMSVVGVAVDHDDLVRYAGNLQVAAGAGNPIAAAKYHGGETRLETPNSLVYAAIATEGVSASSPDALAAAVLQQIMGTGPFIKYSSGLAGSKVARAAAQASSLPFSASCLNINYSDSGLFGFAVAGQSADMGKIMKSVMASFAEVTKGSLTDQEVQRGKNQLKAGLFMSNESSAELLSSLAESSLQGGVPNLPDVIKAVDALTPADISAVAKKIINGKPSMAAVGNLGNTPYLDELM